ncbi:Uncharacterized protein SCF082_LOCUS32581 [Durusdinium trenchii]|uniref:Saposin B-type domain-containing protein n=1 Tax=Durusdinium trenchii TaxID=1381693 RepID=A0ABP0NGD9_9DINO
MSFLWRLLTALLAAVRAPGLGGLDAAGLGAPEEMMASSAVGKKPMRLAKSEPFIACETCKLATAEAWTRVAQKKAERPKVALGEVEIGEVLDSICDPDDDLGEWMTFYDIEQIDDTLSLRKMEQLGECRRECTTLMHACRAVFDEYREDMTEMLFKHYRAEGTNQVKRALSAEKFSSRLCTKLSKYCPSKKPPAGFQHRDEKWMPVIDEESYRMRKMQQALNKQSKEGHTQPVQFLDPMGASMFLNEDEDL